MNERIKENWEKATGSAIPGPGFFASASDYNIEKFAELIVNECMKLNHDHFGDEDPYSIDSLYRYHFGIK